MEMVRVILCAEAARKLTKEHQSSIFSNFIKLVEVEIREAINKGKYVASINVSDLSFDVLDEVKSYLKDLGYDIEMDYADDSLDISWYKEEE